MAVPAWATNLTTFWLEGATTVTAIGTGGAGLGNPETDFFIQGTGCISKAAWTNATKGFIIDALATTFTVPTDGGVIFYAKYDAAGSLDTKANGGFRCIIGSSASAYYHFYMRGKNTMAFDSWFPYVIDPNTATVDNTTGSPSGSERWVGLLATLPTTSGPTKGNPIGIDAIRYGRCDVEYTAGESADYNTFPKAEAYGNDSSRRWGLIQFRNGAYLMQGFHSFGTSGALVDFRDSNRILFWRASANNNVTGDSVSTAFNRVEILNASSNIEWDNIFWAALGTAARGRFVHTAGTVAITNGQFDGWDTFSFLAAAVVTGYIFRGCNAITAPGTTLTDTAVLVPTVATDTSAVIWNVATDPDTYTNGMTFSKGSNAHHAFELGTSSPLTVTFRNWTVSGFGVDTANDAVFHVKRTTGTVTINVLGGSGTFTYKSDGATVAIVLDPVETLVKVLDGRDNSNLQNARVILRASSGTGDLPYLDSVSIVQAAGVATVTHTAHGLVTGNKVEIKGATNTGTGVDYNGPKTITYVNANSYTYAVDSGAGSPATGTITATGLVLEGLTDANGEIKDTRAWTTAQPCIGRVSKATASPYFKDANLVGQISTTLGLSLQQALTIDE